MSSGREAQGVRWSGLGACAFCRAGVCTSCRRCTLILPSVHAPFPVGARTSFAAKLTRFAAKSHHIWRQIYGIMAANLYKTRRPTHWPRASKSQNARTQLQKHMDTRTKIMAATCENDTARKFQSDLTPVETISGKELAERLVARPQRFYRHRNLAFPSHIAICDGGIGKLEGEPI